MGNEACLLRYKWQAEAFRNRYGAFIEKNTDAFLAWWDRLPLYEWVSLPFNGNAVMEAGIGLLCLLYIDGIINLSFNETVTSVMREALTEDEYRTWADKHFMKTNPKAHKDGTQS